MRRSFAVLAAAPLVIAQHGPAATRGAAHAIGIDDAAGTPAPGKAADLLIVDRDPTSDIRNTRRIRYVIKSGRIAFARPGDAP